MFLDFVGIGAQKAGTTWLHRNLQAHPGVWIPKEKEFHYFDEKINDPPNLDGSPLMCLEKEPRLSTRSSAASAEVALHPGRGGFAVGVEVGKFVAAYRPVQGHGVAGLAYQITG